MTNSGLFVVAVQLVVAVPLVSQPLIDVRPQPAGSAASATPRYPVIRANSDLVLVSAIVTDRKGALVDGLPPGQFTVLEDNAPQRILSLSTDDVPCSVGVILDVSGSMRDKLQAASSAVREFLQLANPDDEGFLLTASTRPARLGSLTVDSATLQNKLIGATAEGATALVDTIYLGVTRMRSAHNGRRALLIVSDGMDNHSRYTRQELLRLVQEEDVQIHSIGMVTTSPARKAVELTEESKGLALLEDLADRGGGLSFRVANPDDILTAVTKISRAVRSEYVIAYRETNPDASGKWRTLQVKVNEPGLRVYARHGYYSR